MNDSQRISRLTPLQDVIAAIDALGDPVAARDVDVVDAIGKVLAADVTADPMPKRATAMRDGWAVRADEIADAGAYAPVLLQVLPKRVDSGDEMPPGTDAVAPLEAITVQGQVAEAVSPAAPGEGVSAPGSEIGASAPLYERGQRLGVIGAAALTASGVSLVSVRAPRCLIVAAREDLRLTPAVRVIAGDCEARGGIAVLRNGAELADALKAEDCDAIIVVGGSGSGARDASVQALASLGTVSVHGVGLTPGETTALGRAGKRPVLIVPGRLDGALAGWLVLGRPLLNRLAGDNTAEFPVSRVLSRKVTSTVGLAEVVPVQCDNRSASPLATGNLPLWALAKANGWLLVPPDSEGYPAGAEVKINTWP